MAHQAPSGSGSAVERIGVLGGTFDPVHVGHVVAASDARAQLELDRVLLVVAGDPWQKRGRVVASAQDRLALVEAAVAEVDGLEASSIEIDRGEPSVTADTLEALAGPDRSLFVLLGADAVSNMPTWRRLEETRDLATIVVIEREGEHATPPGDGWAVVHLAIPRLDVSSTDIRERLGRGFPVHGLVPEPAVRVIHAAGSMLRTDDVRYRVEQRRLTRTASAPTTRALVAAAAAAEKKGHDIVVIDVAPIIAIIDRFVLVSASNTRQVRTIVDEVEDALQIHDESKPIGVEGLEDSTWVLLDYGDIVVHVFLDETRAYYDLERLWADAPRVPFEEPRVAAGER